MSQTIPRVQLGDTIRVMQTDTMVTFGHANKIAKVTKIIEKAFSSGSLTIFATVIDTDEELIVMDHSIQIIETRQQD